MGKTGLLFMNINEDCLAKLPLQMYHKVVCAPSLALLPGYSCAVSWSYLNMAHTLQSPLSGWRYRGTMSNWINVQRESGGRVNIFGGDSISHCEKRYSYEHAPKSEGYWDRAVWIYKYKSIL